MALFADYALSGDAYGWAGTTGLFSLTVKQVANMIVRTGQNRVGGTRTHDHRFIRTALLPSELQPLIFASCSTLGDSIGSDRTNGPIFASS